MSPFSILAVLMRRRKLVFGIPVLFLAVTFVAMLLKSREYAAQSRFAPQQRSSNAGSFAGVAAQLGIPLDIGGAGGSESVQFYAALVTSRDLLEALALTKFDKVSTPEGVRSGTVVDLLDTPGSSEAERLNNAVGQLKANTTSAVDSRSNLVILTTTAPSRDLAVKLNARLLELVNDFNVNRRQSAAAAERKFVEARVAIARDELRKAEGALVSFLARNRRYEGSAVKPFDYERLQRDVDLRQSVYATLAQRLEQSRVDEVRNTPVVTVIESPQRSARPVGNPIRAMATALVFGLIVGIALAFARDYYVQERARNPDAYAELERARPRWLNGLPRPSLTRK